MLQPKLPIHLNNQYAMRRSPPVFDSSSPGPDPYHSLQSLHNVYEELHPAHDSDADSEFRGHSDDDFAEDELSLAGDATAVLMATSTSPSPNGGGSGSGGAIQTVSIIPTIYNENNMNYRRMGAGGTNDSMPTTNIERDSVLSITSTTNDRNGAGGDSSTSSRSSSGATRIPRNTDLQNTGPFARTHSKTLNNRDIKSPELTGATHNFNQYHNHVNMSHGNTNKRMNSNRINNNTIAGHHHHHHFLHQQQQQQPHHHQHGGHTAANNNLRSKSRDNICTNGVNGTNGACIECRVERQNQVNRQMSSTMNKKRNGNQQSQMDHSQHHPAGISTIFHERGLNGNNSHFVFPDTNTSSTTQNQCTSWINGNHNQRMRTMPYATSNCTQRMQSGPMPTHDPAYDYAQPVFHEGILYDAGFSSDVSRLQPSIDRNLDCSYIAPEYTSLGSSASGISSGTHPHAIYSRDSSFGSDSGYSRGESGGSASGNVLGLGLGRLKKHTSNNKTMGKSVL